jgi:hypothetical protein
MDNKMISEARQKTLHDFVVHDFVKNFLLIRTYSRSFVVQQGRKWWAGAA